MLSGRTGEIGMKGLNGEKGSQLTLLFRPEKRKNFGREKRPGVDILQRNVEISMAVMYTRTMCVFWHGGCYI